MSTLSGNQQTQSPMQGSLSALHLTLNRLEDAVMSLVNRLETVVEPGKPTDPAVTPSPPANPGTSTVVSVVDSATQRVDSLHAELTSILNRLHL